MSEITLADARANLALWVAASKAVAKGQSYTIGDRQLTRVNAEWIDQMIDYWDRKVTELANVAAGKPARARARRVIFG